MAPPIKIKWQALWKPIPGLTTTVSANLIEVEREVVPIVFVPGIMGSRLKNKKTGRPVWDPDDAVFMATSFLGAGPFERKYMLVGRSFDPEFLAVDNDNAAHNAKFLAGLPGAAQRRWGGVLSRSYAAILKELQTTTWPEPIGHCFELPVHACGYNWTDSNRNSGKKLAQYIKEVIAHYQGVRRVCKQVILVTHSMGGLVGRSACVLWNAAPDVLGVVHGVQPATGAPLAYWQMKSGTARAGEGFSGKAMGKVTAWVLGSTGQEITAILGNMPGGLQLLPNKRYATNGGSRQWLRFTAGGTAHALPASDPYAEIYREKEAWWRLITPEYLEPREPPPLVMEGVVVDLYDYEARKAQAVWTDYLGYIREGETFHDALAAKQHANTVNLHGTKVPTLDKVHYTRAADDWKQIAGNLNPWANSGGFRARSGGEVFTIDGPDGAGDGTVPESSGSALAQGTAKNRRWRDVEHVEHEPFYQRKLVQAYTTTAITNMCRGKILKEVFGAPPDW